MLKYLTLQDAINSPKTRSMLMLVVARIVPDCEDQESIVQEALIAAWRRSDKYDPHYNPLTWLRYVATSVALTFVSRRPPRPLSLDVKSIHGNWPMAEDIVDEVASAALSLVETRTVITKWLSVRAEKTRIVVTLFLEGFTAPQISKAVGMGVKAVESCIHAARVKMRADQELQASFSFPLAK